MNLSQLVLHLKQRHRDSTRNATGAKSLDRRYTDGIH